MNIHPLFVHFPIGLLATYSVLEVASIFYPVLRKKAWLFPVKVFLLSTGILGALAALVTGGVAEGIVENTNPRAFIIETHEEFATFAVLAYFALWAGHVVRLFDREGWGGRIVGESAALERVWDAKKWVAHLLLDTWLLPVLSILGALLLTIAGGLGAAIVYGPDIDPIVRFIYGLFF